MTVSYIDIQKRYKMDEHLDRQIDRWMHGWMGETDERLTDGEIDGWG